MQLEPANTVLKTYGKSFHFAKFFLKADTGDAAARLYRFCRLIDDIADENPDKNTSRLQLHSIQNSIKANVSANPVVHDFLLLCEQYSIDRHHGITLIAGVLQDLEPVALSSYEDLLNYAFRVAGVVGLMMAPILGAERSGYAFAVDLGIGMQLTNIARDVLEDAQMHRRYLPGDWVNGLGVTQILAPNVEQNVVITEAIARLLTTAETFYQSGISGLYFLHPQNRKAIAVAAYLYRDIGRKLLQRQCDYLQGRVAVGYVRKCSLAINVLTELRFRHLAKVKPQHDHTLHHLLSVPLSGETTAP
jgi:phytoene synthase